MSTVHDGRVVPIAVVAWAAALVSTGSWSAPVVLPVWVCCVGVVLGVLAVRMNSHLVAWAGLVLVVVGCVGLVATAQGMRNAAQGAALTEAGATEAWITVTGQSVPMQGTGGQQRHRVEATVTAWRPHCREPPACAPWFASAATVIVALESPPQRGETVLVAARWTASERPPATAIAWAPETVGLRSPSPLVTWRERFALATANLGDDSRGLVRGMVVGDTSSMTPSQVEDMRVSGLAHLTAVSGAHFAILIMACSGALAAMRAPRPVRAAAILAVALTFAALVGAESSVLRALGMAVAVSCAMWWGRPARGLAALAVTVTVLLVLQPQLSRSLGFAMSALAVAAIVLWSPRIAGVLARVVTPGLARVAAIALAAQAAVTPVLVVIEPRLSPYAVVANLAAGVAVLPTMLAGAAALGLATISVDAAAIAAHAAGAAASVIVVVAHTAASAPGAALSWPAGPPGVAAAVVLGVLLMAATAPIHPSRRIAAIIVALGLTGASLSMTDGASGPVMESWDIAACDVGQGDMLLLRAAPDAAVVIDTGPPDGGASDCLERHGISRVPLLVLTHPHQDHDGAVVSVVETAKVESAWVAVAGVEGPAVHALAGAGVAVEVPEPGREAAWGEVAVTVLSEAHARDSVDGNDASVVIHAVVRGTGVLALGDLETDGQRELLTLIPPDLAVDVVKVAHHGSGDQWHSLAARTSGAVALVTAGRDNPYGHPTAAALELYGQTSRALLRTDLCGDLHVGVVDGALSWSQCPTDVAR